MVEAKEEAIVILRMLFSSDFQNTIGIAQIYVNIIARFDAKRVYLFINIVDSSYNYLTLAFELVSEEVGCSSRYYDQVQPQKKSANDCHQYCAARAAFFFERKQFCSQDGCRCVCADKECLEVENQQHYDYFDLYEIKAGEYPKQ